MNVGLTKRCTQPHDGRNTTGMISMCRVSRLPRRDALLQPNYIRFLRTALPLNTPLPPVPALELIGQRGWLLNHRKLRRLELGEVSLRLAPPSSSYWSLHLRKLLSRMSFQVVTWVRRFQKAGRFPAFGKKKQWEKAEMATTGETLFAAPRSTRRSSSEVILPPSFSIIMASRTGISSSSNNNPTNQNKTATTTPKNNFSRFSVSEYLAVHREDGDAWADDEVDEVALTLGKILVAAVAKRRHTKTSTGFLITLVGKTTVGAQTTCMDETNR